MVKVLPLPEKVQTPETVGFICAEEYVVVDIPNEAEALAAEEVVDLHEERFGQDIAGDRTDGNPVGCPARPSLQEPHYGLCLPLNTAQRVERVL
jgi:hypothetical protein